MRIAHSKEFRCKRTGEDITINTTVHGNHIVRTVMKVWQGESWTRYTIVPRQYFITKIRKMYAAQKRHASQLSEDHASAYWRDPRKFCLPRTGALGIASEWIIDCHWHGAGSSFARKAYVRRGGNRKYVVIVQTGGLDI